MISCFGFSVKGVSLRWVSIFLMVFSLSNVWMGFWSRVFLIEGVGGLVNRERGGGVGRGG